MIVYLDEEKEIMPFKVTVGAEAKEWNKINSNEKEKNYMKFEKGKVADIEYMTCNEYMKAIADMWHSSIGNVRKNNVEQEKVDEYATNMKNENISPLPYIDYSTSQQEGRHRMMAFEEINGEYAKAPVLVINNVEIDDVTDDEIRKYAISKWGKENEKWGINYIRSCLGVEDTTEYDDSEELELNHVFDEPDINYDSKDNKEDSLEILSKKSGVSVEELLDMDLNEFVTIANKYIN